MQKAARAAGALTASAPPSAEPELERKLPALMQQAFRRELTI